MLRLKRRLLKLRKKRRATWKIVGSREKKGKIEKRKGNLRKSKRCVRRYQKPSKKLKNKERKLRTN